MRSWIFSFICAVLPAAVMAQDTGLKRLDTTDAGRQWMAVGRLDIKGAGFCTGTLISPTHVLTAAHCLFDKATQTRIDPARIQFLAGWRLGRASAYRVARQTVIHPDYEYHHETTAARVQNDIALIELWQPVRNTAVTPFDTGQRPAQGQEVGVVSYAQDRAETPSLQEVCSVMSGLGGILVMSCDVELGASGAPVFSFLGEQPQIVSIVAAKAEIRGQRVALATPVDDALEVLHDELSAGRGLKASSQGSETDRNIGARFIRP